MMLHRLTCLKNLSPSSSRISFLALLCSLVLVLQPAHARAETEASVIRVSAQGKASASPDQATMTMQFSQTKLKAEDARSIVDDQVYKLTKTLDDFSLKENSLDTSQTRIHPRYDYRNDARQFKGYEVTRDVTFVLQDLTQLEALLAELSESQLNYLNNIQFGVSKPQKVKNKALQQAISRAKKTAAKIAKSFDVTLGKIHSVEHMTSASERPDRPMMRMELASADASSSYQQKDLEFTAHINVAFTFE